MKTTTKIGIVLGSVAVITNPLFSQYLITAIEILLIKAVIISIPAAILFTLFVVFLLGGWYARSERLNIPKKNAKTKSQKYIKT